MANFLLKDLSLLQCLLQKLANFQSLCQALSIQESDNKRHIGGEFPGGPVVRGSFPGDSLVKSLPVNAGDARDMS